MDFLKQNKGINKKLEMSKTENKYIKLEVEKVKNDLNEKNIEINDLKIQLDTKNKIIENSIVLDDFPIFEVDEKKIGIIHTMPIFMIDKIYYDIEFINYNEVYNCIEGVLKTLKEQGMTMIGIQSNNINSYRLKKIIDTANKENLTIYRMFFNTERELTEKILKLEQIGGLI